MVIGLEGKVAVVTGAASGIGRATAMAFAKSGARVVVADVQTDGGEETADRICKLGCEATFIHADVSHPQNVDALLRRTVERYGQLDCACNNAGIEGAQAPTDACSEENWDRVLTINLKGLWLCMKYELPLLLAQGGGAIVNIASIAGLVGFTNLPAYCASKGGVVQLTRTAALEYAQRGIRVNAVCPGGIRTPMLDRLFHEQPEMEAGLTAAHPMGRLGKPAEIAEAVLWLCSDAASFVTGQALAVDGGYVAQ